MPQVAGFAIGLFSAGAVGVSSAMVGGWAAGATIAGSALGGIAVKLLTSVALSALSMAIQGKPKASVGGMRTDQTLHGGINPEGFVLGRFATNGVLVSPNLSHGKANEFLNYVVEFAGVEGHQLDQLILNGEVVEILNDDPHEKYGKRIGGRYLERAWVRYYDGTQTVADPMLLEKYPAPRVRPWTAAMVGRGICYAVFTFQYDREVFQNWPTVRVVLSGVPVYDPRKDSSVGGSGPQRWGNRATYAPSTNNVVLSYNVLRGITLPSGDVWGGGIQAEDLPLTTWKDGMDKCDVLVSDGAGGQEAQYRAGIEVMVEDEPWTVVEELLKACAGSLSESGGVWGVQVGAPSLPIIHITDEDLRADAPDDLKPFPSIENIYNGVAATYPDPDSVWQSREAEPVNSDTLEAEDGGRRLMASVAFPAAPYGLQVKRLMEALLKDHRRMRVHVISLPAEAMVLEAGDCISWTSKTNFYTNKLFEIKSADRDVLSGRVNVSMREVDPSDYNPPVALARPSAPDIRPHLTPRQTVEGFDVEPWTGTDGNGVERRAGARVVWDASAFVDVQLLRLVYRKVGETHDGVSVPVSDVNKGERVVQDPLIPNNAYEFRARLIANRPTSWSGWVQVLIPDVRLTQSDLAQSITDAIDKAVEDSAEAIRIAEDIRIDVEGQAAEAIAQAEAARDAAWEAALDAGEIKDEVEGIRDTTEAYQIASDAAKTAAELARDQAQTSAGNADGSATAAAGSASTAGTKATEAGNSAVAAAASVVEATSAKDDAEDAATATATSASSAATSAGAAGTSAAASQADRLLAQTARSGSETARNQAVTAKDTAEGAASTATTQAGLATTARNQADGFADVAFDHSQSAASQADAAGEAAIAAEADRILAQTARSGAEIAESNAVSAKNTAEGAASTATTQSGLAVTAAYDANQLAASLLPSDFSQDWKYWASSWGGVPGVKSRNFTRWALGTVVGTKVAVVTAPQDGAATLAMQGNISAAAGRRYRIEVSARHVGAFAGGSQSSLRAYLYKIDAGYASAGAFASGFLTFATTNAWETLVYNSPVYDGAETMLNGFIQNVAANMGVAGPRIEVRSIKVLDVTETLAAANSATAAADSASTATSKADDAGSEASAANQSKLAAQAARDLAEGYRDAAKGHRDDAFDYQADAGIAKDDAVSARQGADAAAASALSSMQMSARVTGRGAGVLRDQFLGEDAGFTQYGDVTPIYSPNSQYPNGRNVRLNVPANTEAGLSFSSASSGGWDGALNADAYAIEVEFTLHSGSIVGAGVRLNMSYSGSNSSLNVPLSDMVSTPVVVGVPQVASITMKRPAGSGVVTSALMFFMASYTQLAASRPARQITIHRVSMRAATMEEQGLGAVEATISQKYATTVDTNQAISQSITDYNATVSGGLSARVVSSAVAIANLDGYLAATATLTAEVTGGKISGIRAVSYNGAGGGTSGSLLELLGDRVVAKGTLSVSRLIVTDMSNMVPDGDLRDPSFWTGSGWTIVPASTIAASESVGEMVVVQSADTYCYSDWFPLGGLDELFFSFQAARAGGAGIISIWGGIQFGDASQGVVGSSPVVITGGMTSGTPQKFEGSATPPAAAKFVRWRWAKANTPAATTNGRVFAPVLRKKNGASLIVNGAVAARHLDTLSLSVAGLAIFGGEIRSNNYVAGVSGYRLTQAGDFDINNLIVRNSLVVGSVSDLVQDSRFAETRYVGNVAIMTITLGALEPQDTWTVHASGQLRRTTAMISSGGGAPTEGYVGTTMRIYKRVMQNGAYGGWQEVFGTAEGGEAWWTHEFVMLFAGNYENAQFRFEIITVGATSNTSGYLSRTNARRLNLVARRITR